MCGLAGAPSATVRDHDGFKSAVQRMSDVLQHRGPDDSGTWIDDLGHCGLGFRRLAIQDLSPNGHQPMSSPNRRYTLVFNGEIYNHLDIRRELIDSGYQFRGHSDTETLCAAMEQWGIAATVQRCIGMFAMAIWDDRERSLSLVRDRLGIKPMYLYHRGGLILFGSELKALQAHPEFRAELSTDAIEMFLRYLYIPAPATIFREVTKVRAGHIVTIRLPDCRAESQPFWSVEEAYRHGRANPYEGTESEAVRELEELLFDAVRIRKLADVPLGALLSGGIDSTTVVALMQRDSAIPTRTFSIGFTGSEHDESRHAARIAEHLGTNHTELMLDGRESLDIVPQLPTMFDEPFADPSQIPTFLVCRLARTNVTVALTGDGGDEVFGGYHRYIAGKRLIDSVRRVPRPIRKGASGAFGKLSGDWYPLIAPMAKLSGQRLVHEKLGKMSRMLATDSSNDMYRSLLSVAWQDPHSLMLQTARGFDVVQHALSSTTSLPLLDQMMLVDQSLYLTDDLLAKVDRASMAVSLEARVPLLDHRVIEFAWRVPAQWKIRGGKGKLLLRKVLDRHVPRELIDRSKVGFSVPIGDWLRGPLKGWAESQLRAVREPLDHHAVWERWNRFQQGDSTLALGLWSIVMLESWREAWKY